MDITLFNSEKMNTVDSLKSKTSTANCVRKSKNLDIDTIENLFKVNQVFEMTE